MTVTQQPRRRGRPNRKATQDPGTEHHRSTGDGVPGSHADEGRTGGEPTALIERAFLFADIESSTPLWEQYPDLMARAAERLEEAVGTAVEAAGGKIVGRTGDAIDAAFADVAAAATAATHAQRAIDEIDWGEVGAVRIRMAIDAGQVAVRGDRYYGPPLNRLGRILAAGHGGQVLLSTGAREQLRAHDGFETGDLGEYRFKGIGRPQPVHQLLIAGLRNEFPPLRVGGDARARGTHARGNVRTLRGYDLREELGSGDFGVVHLAFQASVGREVAVKVIRPEHANRPDFVRRFEAEAQVVAQLEHPHIVTLYDFWRDPDGAYLVMSHLRGGSLAGALRRGPWHAEPALTLLEQVGSALSHAHRHGIIHRDLKPANILLDEDGNAYLSDFGIASQPADIAGRPMSSSLAYLPPEELYGGALDRRSDIFSLGVLTFELLTGTGATGRDLPALIRSRADLPTPLADVLCSATHERISERPPSVEEFLDAVRPLLDPGAGRSAARTRALPRMPIRNPYKGLRAFGEADAGDFYGREALVDELVDAVAQSRLVAVVGPSGSGKSSAVRAGLVPALRAGRGTRDGNWLVSETYPGSYPFEELEAAFTRVAVEDPGDFGDLLRGDERGLLRVAKRILPGDDSELVLIIDQFEELFSLVESEETRRLFLAGLSALATDERSRVRVVLTIRADFFDRPLAYPGFGDLFTASLVTVTPPSQASLEQAIIRPAHNVGLQLEPGLASEIVNDVQDQPGGLPLLQYALTELFERREGDRLTIAGYRESGGVTGALARRAEAVYEHLPANVRDTARQVFLRLVALGEGTEDTRRRVARQELTDLPGSRRVEHVLDAFGAHRLVSFDRDASTRDPTVEVAHEALLRHWARLREWVDGARDDLRQHRRLQQAAAEWQDHGEDPAYLLPPERLGPIEGWFAGTTVLLSETERRYVDSSAERRKELEAAEAERRAHEEVLERRAMRRLQAAVAVLAVGVLVAVGLIGLALAESGRADEQRAVAEEAQARAEAQQAIAEEQRAIAEEQERTATARELATTALAELEADAERAILLALEAIDTTRDVDGAVMPEAEAALHTAIRASHLERTLPTGGGISLAPDGTLATAGVDGVLTVWDGETWEPLFEIEGGHTDVPVRLGDALLSLEPDDVDFSPGGERLVVANAEFQGTIIDAVTGEVLTELEERILRPRFSPDGRVVAGLSPQDPDGGVAAAAVIGVWDATTGAIQHRFHHQDAVFDYAFSPDGSRLASTTFGLSHVWNLEDGEEVWALLAGPDVFPGLAVSYTPDGEQIVFGVQNGNIVFRAAGDGGLVRAFPGHDVPAQGGLAFSADGSRIVTVGQLEARVWNAATGQRLFQLAGHAGVIRDVELSPDGSRVYTSSQDGETRIWDISVEGGVEYAFAAALVQPASTWPAFSPDGRHLATGGPDGDVSVFELDTMEVVRTLSTADATHMTAYSGDGTLLATSSILGYFDAPQADWRDAIEVWDAETGERLAAFDQPRGPGWDLALNPDGSLLAWAGETQLRVFDLTSGQEIVSQPSPGGGFTRVVFGPDGDLFAGGAFGGRLIDPTTGDLQVELEDAGRIYDADFTPDGMLVTGALLGGEFRVWDPDTGQALRRLPGESNQGSVSVWEHLVATGHADALSVRDIETGALRFTVEVPTQLLRVRISPDGRFLLANHGSVGMHLYVLPIDDLLDLARSRVTRSLTDTECEDFLRLPSCPPEGD